MLKALVRRALRKSGAFYPLRERVYFRSHPEIGGRRRQQLQFYSALLTSKDLIFDVGANIGQRTAVFATLGRLVVAFEPDPQALMQLRARFRFTRKVVIECVALGAEENELSLFSCGTDALSSLSPNYIKMMQEVHFPSTQWKNAGMVQVKTLDSMIDKYGVPAFIKIDVEGFEQKVIQGLTRAVPLSFEWHGSDPSTLATLCELVHKLSPAYRFNYCLAEDVTFVLDQHVDYQTLMEVVVPELARDPQRWGDIYALLG